MYNVLVKRARRKDTARDAMRDALDLPGDSIVIYGLQKRWREEWSEGLDEERNNTVITTRRNNCGIERTSDPVWRRPIITVADISRRADPAATTAIWHLRGVNWYLERYYTITTRVCMRVCAYVNATRRRTNCAIDKIANTVTSCNVGLSSFCFCYIASG